MRCFPVKFAKCLRTPILKKFANDCFWNYLNYKLRKDQLNSYFSPNKLTLASRQSKIRGSYQRFSFQKGVLKSSQKSQENNCSRVSFLKKRLNEHLWWLLLMMQVTFFKNRAKKVQNVFLQRLCWYKSEWYIS